MTLPLPDIPDSWARGYDQRGAFWYHYGGYRGSNQATATTRMFELVCDLPGGGSIDLHAETWAELQRSLYVQIGEGQGIVGALDLAWIRPGPITKGAWTIVEIKRSET